MGRSAGNAAKPKVRIAKSKVMIYVPPEIHRAVKITALDMVTSATAVYTQAVQRFLEARGSTGGRIPLAPAVTADDRPKANAAPLADMVGAEVIRRLDRLDRDINARFLGLYGPAEARGMAIAISAMVQAGPQGLPVSKITSILDVEGVERGSARLALDALKQAGVARNQDRRWYFRPQPSIQSGMGEPTTPDKFEEGSKASLSPS